MRNVRKATLLGERGTPMLDSDLSVMRRISIFTGLDVSVVEGICASGFVQIEPKGAAIFAQGDTPKFLHVLLSGRLALVGKTDDHREAVVEFFGSGEVVIAPAVLLDMPYLMSGVLMEESRIAYLPALTIREWSRRDLGLCHNIVLVLARHWRLLATQIKDQKLRSAPQRLAAYLLGGVNTLDGRHMVDLTVDKRSLASRLGMTPENLSRNLAQLEAIGVTAVGRRIEIADLDRLRAFCHDDGLV